MSPHFSSFTSEAMRAFGQELAAGHQERRELLAMNRSHTQALLVAAHRDRCETEAARRHQAAQEADARRLFMSELRSGVHALRNRFELARRDMAADFQHMAAELRAAREAFRNRPGNTLEARTRRASRPAEQHAQPGEAPPPPMPSQQAEPYEPPSFTQEIPSEPIPSEPMHAAPAEPPKEEHPAEARPRHTSRAKPQPARKRRT